MKSPKKIFIGNILNSRESFTKESHELQFVEMIDFAPENLNFYLGSSFSILQRSSQKLIGMTLLRR